MTQTFGSNLTPEDIDEALDATIDPVDAPADSYLAGEARAFSEGSDNDYSSETLGGGIRETLRRDAEEGRMWVSDRASRVNDVIREEPMKATLYALIGGVFLGLMLRR